MGRRPVRITSDTNILVRAAVLDDPVQGALAQREITDAELVAVTLPALCEFCWVLGSSYSLSKPEIAGSIRTLIEAENVMVDDLAVEAGLAQLDAGGDFADGVIAYSGRSMGAETLVTFDRRAEAILRARGEAVRQPA